MTSTDPLQLQHPVVHPEEELQRMTEDSAISAIAFSSGVLALGSQTGTIRLRDASSGEVLHTLRGHQRQVNDLSFSPDGRWLLSASQDGLLRRWDMRDGCSAVVLSLRRSLNACDSDGVRMVVVGDDGLVRLWQPAQAPVVFRGHTGMATATALLPDGKRLISGGVDGAVILWDPESNRGVQLYHHGGGVTGCQVSADGVVLVTSGTDGVIKVWDIPRWSMVGDLSGHEGPVGAIALSADGKRVVSGSVDRTVRVWDLLEGREEQVFHSHESAVLSVAWGEGAVWSASADSTARAWDPDRAAEPPSPRLRHHDIVRACLITPDGEQVLSASGDCTIRAWGTTSGVCHQVIRGHQGGVQDIALAPGGRMLASVGSDGDVRLYSRGEIWEHGLVLPAGQGPLMACAFLSRSAVLTGGLDGRVQAWSLVSGAGLFSLSGHSDRIRGCIAHPDGRIITASYDGTVRIWSGGEERGRIELAVTAMALHPAGQTLAIGTLSGEIRLWDLRHGAFTARLTGHTWPVTALTFLGDGSLLTGSAGSSLRIWSPEWGEGQAIQLSRPVEAIAAQREWVTVGDRSGNVWVFSQQGQQEQVLVTSAA